VRAASQQRGGRLRFTQTTLVGVAPAACKIGGIACENCAAFLTDVDGWRGGLRAGYALRAALLKTNSVERMVSRDALRRDDSPTAVKCVTNVTCSCRRASSTWKWHRERTSLGSRYNWLMSQISDLDYKIRQQVDVCNQLHARKQPLDFESPPSPSTSDSDLTCARLRPLRSRPERKLVKTAGTFR
jgi:hypothetical protein